MLFVYVFEIFIPWQGGLATNIGRDMTLFGLKSIDTVTINYPDRKRKQSQTRPSTSAKQTERESDTASSGFRQTQVVKYPELNSSESLVYPLI